MGTTPTYSWPYPESTDPVANGAQDIEDLALAVETTVSGITGKLVAVKHASLTAAQSASVGGGGNVAVTSLSITHTLADAANKLIIHAYLGTAATSNTFGMVGLAVANDGTLIEIGDAAGSRSRVGSYNRTGTGSTTVAQHTSVSFVYAPGDTSSHTYTVRAINVDTSTRTLYINRSEADTSTASFPRGASALVIQEVTP